MCPSSDSNPDFPLDALLAEAGWVQALARRLARDQAEAEDIAQRALALALERRPSAREGLRPWLARVVRRLAKHNLRGDARRGAREAVAAACRSSASSSADEDLQRFELQQDLARRVAALPERDRSLIVRRFYLNLSVAEIAAAASTTPGTVRSQLGRALDRLRAQYAGGSSRGPALGTFLLAAGGGDLVPRSASETVLLSLSTKKVAVATAVLLALVPIYLGTSPADGQRPGGVASTQERIAEPSELAVASQLAVPRVETSRAVVGIERSAAGTPTSAAGTEDSPSTVTTIRARVLDPDLRPLSGASLSSVHVDGSPRGKNASAQSGADGRVTLALDDTSLRRWRKQTFDMTFAVGAEGCATEFRIKRPRLHGETDLGDIVLRTGATLVGVCVDQGGRPLSGAIVYAGTGAITDDVAKLRVRGPDRSVTRPRSVTAEDGSFTLAGIEAAPVQGQGARVRLWAHAPGFLWTIGEPVAVTPSARVDLGPIVLDGLPAERGIRGILYRPDGRPAVGGRIDYLSTGSSDHGSVTAGDDGSFLVAVADATPAEFVGHDPTGQLGPSAAVVARGGDHIELWLRPLQVVLVVVTDRDGDPLVDSDVMPVVPDDPAAPASGGRLLPGRRWQSTDAQGRVEVTVPGQAFAVVARRAGSGTRTVGPFEPESVPKSLTIELPRGPEVSGRVLAHGEPVVGAEVAVMHRYMGFAAMTGGFPNRYPSGAPTVTTDGEGRFAAPFKPEWRSVGIVARAAGLAVGEVELGDLRPSEGVEGIEVHLTEGGAIEGRVLPPPDREVGSLYVAASRGDGRPLSVRVATDGSYRLDGLTPGPWRVEGRLREVRTEMLSTTQDPETLEPRWNASVVDGKTTELDIDMRHSGPAELRGELRIDGAPPPRGWSVEVLTPPDLRGPAETRSADIDRSGRFSIIAPPGQVALRLVGPVGEGASIELTREVEFVGPGVQWVEDLATARVEESLEAGIRRARFVRVDATGRSRDVTNVAVEADGTLSARVPVGRSRLEGMTNDGAKRWSLLRRLVVR
ncbi:MAG: sigma-70 family RNA polymerase sigma factor [Planctomycetota bacterium]